jgi:hypothetical protein
LAENAQEFIFVHIPNKNTGDNPLRQKQIGRTSFVLGATPMKQTVKCYICILANSKEIR